MNYSMKKHNGIISLWKFIYSIMIVCTHVGQMTTSNAKYVFEAGSVGVEFFFIVSGYFLGKKALTYRTIQDDELGKETFDFIWKKIKTFFPWMLITYIFSVPAFYFVNHLHKFQIINSIWDILFLKESGIKYYSVMGVTWYISIMLIVMTFLYPLILKYRKNFVYIIAPLIVILVGGYVSHKYGNIGAPDTWDGFVYKSFWRGLFEISLGVIIYEFVEKIKSIDFTKFAKILLTITEMIGFVSILLIVNIKDAHNKYDFIMILIMAISISISFSEKTYDLKIWNNKVIYFLEKLSLPVFLNQIWIILIRH